MKAEEKRGLHGFHDYSHCVACKLSPDGWELWGENGHLQGHIPQGSDLEGAQAAPKSSVSL